LAASSLTAAAQECAGARSRRRSCPRAGGQRPAGAPPPPMRLLSADISDGKALAAKLYLRGGNRCRSPALQWMQPPRGTASFALIVHDMEPRPRKGVDDILHWMVWKHARRRKFASLWCLFRQRGSAGRQPPNQRQRRPGRNLRLPPTVSGRRMSPWRTTTHSSYSPWIKSWICPRPPPAPT